MFSVNQNWLNGVYQCLPMFDNVYQCFQSVFDGCLSMWFLVCSSRQWPLTSVGQGRLLSGRKVNIPFFLLLVLFVFTLLFLIASILIFFHFFGQALGWSIEWTEGQPSFFLLCLLFVWKFSFWGFFFFNYSFGQSPGSSIEWTKGKNSIFFFWFVFDLLFLVSLFVFKLSNETNFWSSNISRVGKTILF